jgi:hypothetical protein
MLHCLIRRYARIGADPPMDSPDDGFSGRLFADDWPDFATQTPAYLVLIIDLGTANGDEMQRREALRPVVFCWLI